jgi:hypothetical protein
MITWLRAEDVLPASFASPLYFAEMESVPAVVKEVVRVARLPLSVAVPSVCDPERKVTDPVAAPPYWLVTVAVNVTDWPVLAGFSDDEREVIVVAMFTFWLSGPDVLPLKLPEAWYAAVIECVPDASNDVESDALPLARVALPSVVEVEVSVKMTVPVGVPEAELTAAVKVTACP